MPASRYFATIGAVSAFISVLAGAFGAHALRSRLEPNLLQAFETGARYQMYHALGLLACAWILGNGPAPWGARAGWAFLLGTLLFSGSLYTMSLTGILALGAITPFGGLAFLAGWIMLAVAARPR
jgi:uncharacterized membrane protein YgdD (TMEM256/DUF423 family)